MHTTEDTTPSKPKSKWQQNLTIIGSTIAYMIPLFVLWQKTGYPDDFGVHITAHGKAGLIENWWYTYRLLTRHRPLDIALFIYMWAPVLAFLVWIVRAAWKDHKAKSAATKQPLV